MVMPARLGSYLFNEVTKLELIDAIPKFTMVSNETYYFSLLAETIKKI